MAKRFIDTDLFKDRFIRGLEAPLKPLWVYLFCDCNASGIWNVELDVAKMRCGVGNNITDAHIKEAFAPKIIEIDNGEKWFIPSFVKIQYNNELKAKNPATKKVIKELKYYNLLTKIGADLYQLNSSPFEAPSKPLLNNQKGAKDMEEEKEEEKDMEEEEEKDVKKIILPYNSKQFITAWDNWKKYKLEQFNFKYKSVTTEQAALMKLSQLSGGYEANAIDIIHQSMAQGWKGFFELENNNNNNGNKNKKFNEELHRATTNLISEYINEAKQ